MRIQPMAAVLFLLLAANADGAETSLQSGTTFQDCTDCPVMVVIPPGSFMMGETVDEETTWHEEAGERGTASPPRKITIRKSFALGKFEITRAEFAAFVKETNYRQHGDICLRLVANTNVDVPRGGHFQPDASSIQMTGLGWRNPRSEEHTSELQSH